MIEVCDDFGLGELVFGLDKAHPGNFACLCDSSGSGWLRPATVGKCGLVEDEEKTAW